MSPRVGLVIVSHSLKLAEGVRELAQQMAPDVHIGVAGGLPDGGIGTSFDLIEDAVDQTMKAAGGRGVAVLTDLGSATMTVESVIDFAGESGLVKLADGPLVEGAVAAAVAAQQNEDLANVVAAVESAAEIWVSSSGVNAVFGLFDETAPKPVEASPAPSAEVVIADVAGLHARPAAQLARMAAGFDAKVMVNGVNASSVLELMSLGKKQGETVTVSAVGPAAEQAVEEITQAIAAGFDK